MQHWKERAAFTGAPITYAMGVTMFNRISTPTSALVAALAVIMAACAGNDPSAATPTATVSGVVKAATGAVIEGAAVTIGSATVTTAADGRFEQGNLPVGSATISASAA